MLNIVIAPLHNTYFAGRGWEGLNLEKIKSYLENYDSPDISVEVIHFRYLLEYVDTIKEGSFIFYSSSYDESYRKYISEVVYHLSRIRPDLRVIPNYDILLCHENKGYQELLKQRLNICELKGYYLGDITDLQQGDYAEYPYVVKMPGGAGSSNVALVKDFSSLKAYIRKKAQKNLIYTFKRLVKPFLLKNQSLMINYREFYTTRTPFVLQEMVKDLQHDYKILIFGKRYYALKRYVRDNDFRASGSGKFTMEKPSAALLDFSQVVFEKLDVPFISLDIAEKDGQFYVIELQGTGFGPATLERSEGYFNRDPDSGEWTFVDGSSMLEEQYAEALLYFNLMHEKRGTLSIK